MAIVQNPFQQWNDPLRGGRVIFSAKIYVGQPDTDPTVPANQLQVFYIDENEQQINLAQPLTTDSGGYIVISDTNPTKVQARVAESNYSITVQNKQGANQWVIPNASEVSPIIDIQHNDTGNRNNSSAHTADSITKFSNTDSSSQSAVMKSDADVVINVPGDISNWVDAVNFAAGSIATGTNVIQVNLQSGYQIGQGLRLTGGDYSSIKITSDDATVSLAAGFVGADTSGIPTGILGETPRQPLLCAYKAKCPEWDIVVDMGNQYGTGHQLCESEIVVNPLKGVINAGFRGIQIHGRANIYQANYNGASGSGIRLQQASSCVARSSTADNCCSTEDTSLSAVYVSRSSLLEFRGGSAQNSGASGLIARRSKVTADEANFNGSTSRGVQAENEAEVSFANGFALNCGSNAIRSIANAKVYAVGTQSSTTSSAQNLNVDIGGVITIASSNQIEGGTGETNALAESNVTYFNAFDEAGMIFYDASNGTFKIESDSNGIIQKFADGRMLSFINTSIDTGTVTSGSFSAQLSMPTQPATTAFVSVDGSSMDVIGRSTTGGGGTRICVRHYYRPTVLTGSAFRIENTGQQLDGAGTGQSVQSVNVSMITYGTWR